MRIDYTHIEKVMKGMANKRRLQILVLLDEEGGLTLSDISERLNMGYLNVSDHARKMIASGLISRKNEGVTIHLSITTLGRNILVFCKKLK